MTIGMFAISLAIFIMGYISTKTNANYLTVVAVLGCLPASKCAVSLIMFLKAKECSSEDKDMIEAARRQTSGQIRNIAVDAGATLKDDRNTDADQLYKDAERLAQELKSGQKSAIEEDARNETVEMQHQQKPDGGEQKEYSGPSVVSYNLEGRKASHLKIPAYRCYGEGDVTVIITVNPQGQVLNAKVMEDISATDECLRNFAIRAARLSRFSASPTAPARQNGEIVYRFVAQ